MVKFEISHDTVNDGYREGDVIQHGPQTSVIVQVDSGAFQLIGLEGFNRWSDRQVSVSKGEKLSAIQVAHLVDSDRWVRIARKLKVEVIR